MAERRAQLALEAEEAVGPIGVRELMLIGSVMYWCEGTKAKPWRRHYHVSFVNSDVGLLRVFLAFLESVGLGRADLSYRVSIHETADAPAATRWWCDRLDLPMSAMRRPTIKRHTPATVRRNTGDTYHGCLVVEVPRSRELYWWIEATMSTVVDAAATASRSRRGAR